MPEPLSLSALVRSALVDRAGDKLGRVEDVIVRLADGALPPLSGVKARVGGRALFVPIDRIADLERGSVRLSKDKLNLGQFERRPGEVLLGEDLLGRKVIDVDSARLVTAHDIVLSHADGKWRVSGVRLRGRRWRRKASGSAHVVPWEQIEPFVGHVPTSRLRIGPLKLSRLHPAQIADLVEAASHEEGGEIIDAVGSDRELEADVFEELDDEHQVEFVRERSDQDAAALIARMATDDAADLITELPQERREPILSLLPGAQQRQIKALLGYNPQTAGGLMSPDYLGLSNVATVENAIRAVADSSCHDEALSAVLLVDDAGVLAGSVSMLALLRNSGEMPLAQLITGEVQAVRPDADLPEVARLMSDYNLTLLPVVDEEDKPIGVVTVDDVLELVLPRGWRRRHQPSRD